MLEPPPTDTLVVGCGNLLRGDDAVGPILVRMLAHRDLPEGVRLVDGGTAGMDVALAMRGVRRVLLVDASRIGVEPGTVHRVPGSELTDLSPPLGNLHSFRWDQALGFAQWLLKDDYPGDVTVYLVEGAAFEQGEALSPAVQAAVERVCEAIVVDVCGDAGRAAPPPDIPGTTVSPAGG